MSSPRLIFSFASGMEFAVSRDELPDLAVIKFGQGFDDIGVKFGKVAFTVMNFETDKFVEPIIQFNLKSAKESSPSKVLVEKSSASAEKSVIKSVGISLRTVSAPTTGFTATSPTVLPSKGKEILHEEESIDAYAPLLSKLPCKLLGSEAFFLQFYGAHNKFIRKCITENF